MCVHTLTGTGSDNTCHTVTLSHCHTAMQQVSTTWHITLSWHVIMSHNKDDDDELSQKWEVSMTQVAQGRPHSRKRHEVSLKEYCRGSQANYFHWSPLVWLSWCWESGVLHDTHHWGVVVLVAGSNIWDVAQSTPHNTMKTFCGITAYKTLPNKYKTSAYSPSKTSTKNKTKDVSQDTTAGVWPYQQLVDIICIENWQLIWEVTAVSYFSCQWQNDPLRYAEYQATVWKIVNKVFCILRL